jgi:hypothetical protein
VFLRILLKHRVVLIEDGCTVDYDDVRLFMLRETGDETPPELWKKLPFEIHEWPLATAVIEAGIGPGLRMVPWGRRERGRSDPAARRRRARSGPYLPQLINRSE